MEQEMLLKDPVLTMNTSRYAFLDLYPPFPSHSGYTNGSLEGSPQQLERIIGVGMLTRYILYAWQA